MHRKLRGGAWADGAGAISTELVGSDCAVKPPTSSDADADAGTSGGDVLSVS